MKNGIYVLAVAMLISSHFIYAMEKEKKNNNTLRIEKLEKQLRKQKKCINNLIKQFGPLVKKHEEKEAKKLKKEESRYNNLCAHAPNDY